MRLIEINKKEFENFCNKNDQSNFFQTKYYAQIKRKEGYHTYFLGLEQDGIICAATILLSKTVSIFGNRIFYAPRGFIIDYKDYRLLSCFTIAIKDFVEQKKGIYLKINPMFKLSDRDYKGDIIIGGLDNSKVVENLLNLNYKQTTNKDYLVEPNFLYELSLNKSINDLESNFSDTLKDIIKRNDSIGIKTFQLKKDEYHKFLDIVINNNNVSNFLHINKNNFKSIIDILESHKLLRIVMAELDIDKYLEISLQSKNNCSDEKLLKQIDKQIETVKNLQYKYGHKILLGGTLGIEYNNQYTVAVNVVIDKFNNFDPLSTIYWNEIKYAKESNKTKFNFYGIGNSLENNKLLNTYKNYNGKVVELIGEFDYVIKPISYKKEMIKLSSKHRY